jgi:hypothetical protein
MYFDEALADLLMLIASGSVIENVHPGKAKITNGCTLWTWNSHVSWVTPAWD